MNANQRIKKMKKAWEGGLSNMLSPHLVGHDVSSDFNEEGVQLSLVPFLKDLQRGDGEGGGGGRREREGMGKKGEGR